MNHLFKKKELGFSGTYKNNNYFCLFYPTNILIYGFHRSNNCWQLFSFFVCFTFKHRYFAVCIKKTYFLLSKTFPYALLFWYWCLVRGFQNMMWAHYLSRCSLLMKQIKHHAWQSKKLTLWEPGGYRFNFSSFRKTTIILYNSMPQSWWRSSALILSLLL